MIQGDAPDKPDDDPVIGRTNLGGHRPLILELLHKKPKSLVVPHLSFSINNLMVDGCLSEF